MKKYDFSNLTYNQQMLLSFQGWTIEFAKLLPQPTAKTVKKLKDRGLIIEHERVWNGLTVKEYEVPLAVHIEWCERCSKNYKE